MFDYYHGLLISLIGYRRTWRPPQLSRSMAAFHFFNLAPAGITPEVLVVPVVMAMFDGAVRDKPP